MNSKIFIGHTYHKRFFPKEHSFKYPLFFFGVDVDELDQLSNDHMLFSYNGFSAFSIHDKDYLSNDKGSIREKVNKVAKELHVKEVEKVLLFTIPRFFSYVFNPVSFYYALDKDKNILFMISEVRNTFGEVHLYKLLPAKKSRDLYYFDFNKEFFVSPFLDRSGSYEIITKSVQRDFSIQVSVKEGSKKMFFATQIGKETPFSSSNLRMLLWRYPLSVILVMIRIHYQALFLFWKRVGTFKKPELLSGNSFVIKVGILDKFRKFVFRNSKQVTINRN